MGKNGNGEAGLFDKVTERAQRRLVAILAVEPGLTALCRKSTRSPPATPAKMPRSHDEKVSA